MGYIFLPLLVMIVVMAIADFRQNGFRGWGVEALGILVVGPMVGAAIAYGQMYL